jgi:hypothetical protein
MGAAVVAARRKPNSRHKIACQTRRPRVAVGTNTTAPRITTARFEVLAAGLDVVEVRDDDRVSEEPCRRCWAFCRVLNARAL